MYKFTIIREGKDPLVIIRINMDPSDVDDCLAVWAGYAHIKEVKVEDYQP